MTIQPALAALPEANIDSASYVVGGSTGGFPNGGSIPVPTGQNSVAVTFNYRGYDDNDHIRATGSFECAWSVGSAPSTSSYSSNNCPAFSTEQTGRFSGHDGVTRTYNFKTGHVTHNFAYSTSRSYFGVRVVSDVTSSPAVWAFTMNRVSVISAYPIGGSGPLPPPAPGTSTATIALTRIIDGHNSDITRTRLSVTRDITFWYSTTNAQIVCQEFGNNPSDPTTNWNCAAPINNEYNIGVSIPGNAMNTCTIAVDSMNRYNAPLCTTVNLIPVGSTPPGTVITGAWTGPEWQEVPARSSVPINYNYINFLFQPLPDPFPQKLEIMQCNWDNSLVSSCGSPLILCLPLTAPTGCNINFDYILEHVSGIAPGSHGVFVTAKYIDSEPDPTPAQFNWCVYTCNPPGAGGLITPQMADSYRFWSGSHISINQSEGLSTEIKFIAISDPKNLTVSAGSPVTLKGGMIIVPPKDTMQKLAALTVNATKGISNNSAAMENEVLKFQKEVIDNLTSNVKISSINWSQESGPQVKLEQDLGNNSVASKSVIKFKAPAVEKDTPLSFKFKTIVNGKEYNATAYILDSPAPKNNAKTNLTETSKIP